MTRKRKWPVNPADIRSALEEGAQLTSYYGVEQVTHIQTNKDGTTTTELQPLPDNRIASLPIPEIPEPSLDGSYNLNDADKKLINEEVKGPKSRVSIISIILNITLMLILELGDHATVYRRARPAA